MGPGGNTKSSFFAKLVRWGLDEVDFTNKVVEQHEHMFSSLYFTWRHFKGDLDLCFVMLQLLFPWRRGNALKVPLMSNGLVTPVFSKMSVEMLDVFQIDMRSSKSAVAARSAKKAADKALAEAPEHASAKRSSQPPAEDHTATNFADELNQFEAYLTKIDPENPHILSACDSCIG
jgi:hypothetical protein